MTETVHERIDRAAENSTFKLLARACMILVIPIGGFIGVKIWEKVDRTNESTIRQEEALRNIIAYHIPNLASQFDSRFNAQAARIDDTSRRIGKLEDWRLSMPVRGNP